MQAVPLAFFLFLVELAAGGLIVTALLDWDGEVSGGYLFLNGIFMLGAAAAGVWLRSVLPAARLWPAAAESPWQRAELAAWALFAVVAATQLFCIRTDRRRAGRAFGVLAGACGLAAITVSSLTYGAHTFGAVGLAVSLIAGALVLGSAWSGMMLGHWYLVTPLLAPRPLLRLNAALAAVLVFQGVWALLPLATGGLDQPLAWLYALRIGVGIAAPLAITLPIWRTARVRSMMSATGLLYVALGLVLAGEIIAKALFFVAGTPT